MRRDKGTRNFSRAASYSGVATTTCGCCTGYLGNLANGVSTTFPSFINKNELRLLQRICLAKRQAETGNRETKSGKVTRFRLFMFAISVELPLCLVIASDFSKHRLQVTSFLTNTTRFFSLFDLEREKLTKINRSTVAILC